MARVLAVVPDLMLASRVEATLTAAGHEVRWRRLPSRGDLAERGPDRRRRGRGRPRELWPARAPRCSASTPHAIPRRGGAPRLRGRPGGPALPAGPGAAGAGRSPDRLGEPEVERVGEPARRGPLDDPVRDLPVEPPAHQRGCGRAPGAERMGAQQRGQLGPLGGPIEARRALEQGVQGRSGRWMARS